jgi:multidrug transporter EmrE-like cation transporter
MKLYYLFICIFAGFIAAMPVIVCQQFYNENNFKFFRIVLFFIIITTLWTILTIIYLYFIFKKIQMGVFFPIIKIIEILFPVIISIIFYKDHYNIFNYMGYLTALIAIILLSQ